MSQAQDRVDVINSLPIGAAAQGDPNALLDLACSTFWAGRSGMMSFESALAVALTLGRLSSWHGGADACHAMSVFLGHHAKLAPTVDERDLRVAEAVAWLHRAAEAGHKAADKMIEGMVGDDDLASVLAAASLIEKQL